MQFLFGKSVFPKNQIFSSVRVTFFTMQSGPKSYEATLFKQQSEKDICTLID